MISIFVKPFEFSIVAIHDALKGAGVDEAFGPSIILFTLILKAVTFPLNKQQVESTSKMQAIQPAAKALQEKYRDKDPARLNLELQKLYNDNQVNPLAGCLPAFAQIPIFIGLYRSVLNLAKADRLDEYAKHALDNAHTNLRGLLANFAPCTLDANLIFLTDTFRLRLQEVLMAAIAGGPSERLHQRHRLALW